MSAAPSAGDPRLGAAIVTYCSQEVITGCLASLHACRDDIARVVVTDNASTDGTCAAIRTWASEHGVSFAETRVGTLPQDDSWLVLQHAPVNGGFAYGTNRSLDVLLADPSIDLLWVLNPDCRAAPGTAGLYRGAGRDQNFALMSGRTVFEADPGVIQTDGGRISLWTGVAKLVNWGASATTATFPDPASIDFVTGANCVASRRFIKEVGMMEEHFFLYYEEVDWACRRGDLPLRLVPDAIVVHHGGTSIGSGSVNRRPSPLSNYFNHRNRMKFIRRHRPAALPLAFAYGLAKAAQLVAIGTRAEAGALLAGILNLPPPAGVRARLAPEAWDAALGKRRL